MACYSADYSTLVWVPERPSNNIWGCGCKIFTGWMPFLSPNRVKALKVLLYEKLNICSHTTHNDILAADFTYSFRFLSATVVPGLAFASLYTFTPSTHNKVLLKHTRIYKMGNY